MLKHIQSFLNLLFSPLPGFRSDFFKSLSPVILMIILFAVYTTGVRILEEFYRRPEATVIRVEELRRAAAENPLLNMGGGGGRLRRSVAGLTDGSVFSDAVRTALPGAVFILYILEIGAVLGLCAQFLGGEEQTGGMGKYRGRTVLVCIGFIPLAIRKITESIFMWLQDPGNIWNASSFEAYRKATEISFSLMPDLSGIPALLRYILYFITDPFIIWSAFIFAAGFAAVYRVRIRTGIAAAAAVIVTLAVNESVLESIGFSVTFGRVM